MLHAPCPGTSRHQQEGTEEQMHTTFTLLPEQLSASHMYMQPRLHIPMHSRIISISHCP